MAEAPSRPSMASLPSLFDHAVIAEVMWDQCLADPPGGADLMPLRFWAGNIVRLREGISAGF